MSYLYLTTSVRVFFTPSEKHLCSLIREKSSSNIDLLLERKDLQSAKYNSPLRLHKNMLIATTTPKGQVANMECRRDTTANKNLRAEGKVIEISCLYILFEINISN